MILTKIDGDARGGAALSIRKVTGAPVKFVGVGEKYDALEPFLPDRIVSRILGMGDVLGLIEKAEKTIDEKKAREMERKLREDDFTLAGFPRPVAADPENGLDRAIDGHAAQNRPFRENSEGCAAR